MRKDLPGFGDDPLLVRRPTPLTILLLVAIAFGFVAFWAPAIGVPGCIAACVALGAYGLYLRFDAGAASRRWLARAANHPIVLQPPFVTRRRVVSGGPDPRHNDHRSFSDQLFAYDFEPVDGEAMDATIVAPCDGMIVHVENRDARPFGSYLSLETPGGYVILAHLQQGSISVRAGEQVRAGDPIGRCAERLHVHAQNRASAAIATADGVPIAFLDRGANEAVLLEYGDTLG